MYRRSSVEAFAVRRYCVDPMIPRDRYLDAGPFAVSEVIGEQVGLTWRGVGQWDME